MGKSNYEVFADNNQDKKLSETVTLEVMIGAIKSYTPILNDTMIRGMQLLVQRLFDMTGGETDRLLNGDEYWLC